MHKNLRKILKKSKKSLPIIVEAVLSALLVCIVGYGVFIRFMPDRIPPHVRVGMFPVSGMKSSEVLSAMDAYEKEFLQTPITVSFRGARSTHTLQELGASLNKEQTANRIITLAGRPFGFQGRQVTPAVIFHDDVALSVLHQDFSEVMVVPQNATLTVDPNKKVRIVPAKSGEYINTSLLNAGIERALGGTSIATVEASAIAETPEFSLENIEPTRIFTESLIASGFHLVGPDNVIIDIVPSAVLQMISFTTDKQPVVRFDDVRLRNYIAESIAPKIRKEPINAKFEIVDGKVQQFSLPEDGRELDVDATVKAINDALATRAQVATAQVNVVSPLISDTGDSEKLGITTLLSTGESNYKGSPKNRVHNIGVGASRYHGILIAPNEEFSFNALLGPVDREAGYLPELVIKDNSTIPEFGGGLCQVSSTVFRAAAQAGMKITQRRNHSYAVRYYGTPGFDATIYPPYTDFRFTNNTPGYVLIQMKIEGTKLKFEFWGTSDNRSVEIDGPHPYDYKPDGSVKSILKQKVMVNGETIIDDTFRSNYKSPNLYPHA